MKRLSIISATIIAGVLAIAACSSQVSDNKESQVQASTGKVSYTCPMHPEITSDKPGSCPKCGMDLVKQEVSYQTTQTIKTNIKNADSMKISGNCGMCKKRIETAAISVPGVKSASWDGDTKMLQVVYEKESKSDEIQKAIAKAGHDTPKYKATREVYDALPGCCRYRE